MSNSHKTNICNVQVIEYGINLCDRRPLMSSFKNLDINPLRSRDSTSSKPSFENLRRYSWRWDNSQKHRDSVNSCYGNIVDTCRRRRIVMCTERLGIL